MHRFPMFTAAFAASTALTLIAHAQVIDPNKYLGAWCQAAPRDGCTTTSEPFEAKFVLTAYGMGGYFQGTYSVACVSSGQFGSTPGGPTAQLDGNGTVTISFPAGSATYRVNLQG